MIKPPTYNILVITYTFLFTRLLSLQFIQCYNNKNYYFRNSNKNNNSSNKGNNILTKTNNDHDSFSNTWTWNQEEWDELWNEVERKYGIHKLTPEDNSSGSTTVDDYIASWEDQRLEDLMNISLSEEDWDDDFKTLYIEYERSENGVSGGN